LWLTNNLGHAHADDAEDGGDVVADQPTLVKIGHGRYVTFDSAINRAALNTAYAVELGARPKSTGSGCLPELIGVSRHDDGCPVVQHRQAVLAHAEFGAVIVAAARVEIDEHLARFKR
jgi:hypothetical protein